LVSCQALKPKKVDLRNVPGNAADKRKRNIEEGRGFSAMGAIKNRGKGSGNFSFASSNEMWRATLELLDFTPLQNVDYSGGIIVTDWFKENNKQDPLKITIRFLSNEIRADGIKVIIHKKKCKNVDECKVTKVDSTLGQEIKLAILQKAALLKEDEMGKNPKYSPFGLGRPDGKD
tara:strand:- start:10 stop:534 length:525 start_codon:yes stop_codon:yes gene_type:complete